MKNKLIGIIVCLLFIASAIIPIASSIGKTTTLNPGVVDQHQDLITNVDWLEGGVPHYQEFVNQGSTLEEIQLHMGCYYSGSYDMIVSIEKPLGTKLSFVTLTAAMFPLNSMGWMTINLPDKQLTRGQNYFIVVQFDIGSEYAWSGDNTDPYPSGGSSHSDPNWDYAFRTIVDKSKKVNYDPKIVTDQKQEQCNDCAFVPNYAYQGFVPEGHKLLKVDLCIAHWFSGSPDLEISIEKPLGTSLTSASLTPAQIPTPNCNWVSIDLNPKIILENGETYFIVLDIRLVENTDGVGPMEIHIQKEPLIKILIGIGALEQLWINQNQNLVKYPLICFLTAILKQLFMENLIQLASILSLD